MWFKLFLFYLYLQIIYVFSSALNPGNKGTVQTRSRNTHMVKNNVVSVFFFTAFQSFSKI